MFTALISHLPALVHPVTRELATQVLVLVSSVQLVEQTARAILRAHPRMVSRTARLVALSLPRTRTSRTRS